MPTSSSQLPDKSDLPDLPDQPNKKAKQSTPRAQSLLELSELPVQDKTAKKPAAQSLLALDEQTDAKPAENEASPDTLLFLPDPGSIHKADRKLFHKKDAKAARIPEPASAALSLLASASLIESASGPDQISARPEEHLPDEEIPAPADSQDVLECTIPAAEPAAAESTDASVADSETDYAAGSGSAAGAQKNGQPEDAEALAGSSSDARGDEQAGDQPDEKTGEKTEQCPQDKKCSKSGRILRVLSVVGRSFALVLLSLTVILLALTIIVMLKADEVTEYALGKLTADAGVEFSIASADICLAPMPGLLLKDVKIRPTEEMYFQAKSVIMFPNLLTVLSGRPQPEVIFLDEPTFSGRLPQNTGELTAMLGANRKAEAQPAAQAQTWTEFVNTYLPLHSKLEIRDGQAQLVTSDGSWIKLLGLNTNLTAINFPLQAVDAIRGHVSIASLQLSTPAFAAQAADIDFEGQTNPHYVTRSLRARFMGRVAVTPLGLASTLDIRLDGSRLSGLKVGGDARGSFALDGCVIPWQFTGEVVKELDSDGLPYQDLLPRTNHDLYSVQMSRMALGDDVLSLDARFVSDPENPALAGRLSFEHASLTRWLDFARDLSPGLQRALNNITDGEIDFVIDMKHLDCPSVRARCAGSLFAGRGGVAKWSDPVVFLDMTSDYVDLGRAIPEAVGKMQPAPKFGHKPLTSMTMADIFPNRSTPSKSAVMSENAAPGELRKKDGGDGQAAQRPPRDSAPKKASGKAQPEEEGLHIGYDIRLGSARIHYGYSNLTNSGVVITPGVNSRGDKGAKLALKTDMYGGTCTGDAYFTGTTETEYEFNISTQNVNMARVFKDIDFIVVNKGQAQSQIRVRSKGSEIDRFLANLQGSIKVKVTNAGMKNDKLFSPFAADISLALASGAFKDSALGLNGRWDVQYKGDGWDADAALKGMLWFGGVGDKAGIRFDNADATLDARNFEHLATFARTTGLPLKVRGKAWCETSQMAFGFKKSHIEVPGLTADGKASIRAGGKLVTLSADFSSASLTTAEFAEIFFGKKPDLPSFLQKIPLGKTEVEASSERVRLSRVNAHIDGISVNGSITATNFQARPRLAFDLRCGDVTLDKYITSDKKKVAQKKAERKDTLTVGDSKKETKTQVKEAVKLAGKPWDLSFMKDFSASGTVKADSLLVNKVRLQNLTVPLTLDNGHMQLSNVTGTMYNGALAASGSVQFDKGLSYTSKTMVAQFDLGAMLRDRKTKGIFHGRTDFRGEFSSSMTGPGQMISHLNGSLSFSCGKGYYQPSDENYKPTGDPMRFDRGLMTGTIKNGVLHLDVFDLDGSDISLTGSGTFDLNREIMDCNFEADMPRMPTVPLRLHGSFDNPKTSIGGMVIFNAIGGLFKGVFNLIGGLFGGIADIFR